MEFEKGKYYEFVSGVEVFIGLYKYANKVNNTTWCNIVYSLHTPEEQGNEVGFPNEDFTQKNSFNNLHEVSARIKEIEKESWEVKEGQIWETRWNGSKSAALILKVLSVENKDAREHDYDCEIEVLNVLDKTVCKHNEGDMIGVWMHFDDLDTPLSKEQYQERINMLEEDEIKKNLKIGSWVLLKDCDYAVKVYSFDNDSVWTVGNAQYPFDLIKLITEQEAVKILTGKDYILKGSGFSKQGQMQGIIDQLKYVIEDQKKQIEEFENNNYVLLEENQDVYDMKTVEGWRQLAEMFESGEIDNLKAEVKRLNEVSMRSNVGYYEIRKQNEVLKHQIERLLKWGKAKRDQSYMHQQLITDSFIKSIETEQKGIIHNLEYGGDPTGDQLKGILNLGSTDTAIIDNDKSIIKEIHEAVTELKEKYLP